MALEDYQPTIGVIWPPMLLLLNRTQTSPQASTQSNVDRLRAAQLNDIMTQDMTQIFLKSPLLWLKN